MKKKLYHVHDNYRRHDNEMLADEYWRINKRKTVAVRDQRSRHCQCRNDQTPNGIRRKGREKKQEKNKKKTRNELDQNTTKNIGEATKNIGETTL